MFERSRFLQNFLSFKSLTHKASLDGPVGAHELDKTVILIAQVTPLLLLDLPLIALIDRKGQKVIVDGLEGEGHADGTVMYFAVGGLELLKLFLGLDERRLHPDRTFRRAAFGQPPAYHNRRPNHDHGNTKNYVRNPGWHNNLQKDSNPFYYIGLEHENQEKNKNRAEKMRGFFFTQPVCRNRRG